MVELVLGLRHISYIANNITKNKGVNREKKFKKFVHPHYSARYLCGSLPVPARPDSEAVSFKWNKILYGERVHFSSRSDTLCHLSQQEEKEITLSGYYYEITELLRAHRPW